MRIKYTRTEAGLGSRVIDRNEVLYTLRCTTCPSTLVPELCRPGQRVWAITHSDGMPWGHVVACAEKHA